jgi:hypothetical protein
VEYRKHIFGEAVKGLTAAIVGALLLWGGQNGSRAISNTGIHRETATSIRRLGNKV